MCKNDVEHVLHIFLDCSYAKQCLNHMELDFNTFSVKSCAEWLLNELAMGDKDHLRRLTTALWGVWSARNLLVWENKYMTPEMAMQQNSRQVAQWREMQKGKAWQPVGGTHLQEPKEVRWLAPIAGTRKINVDASVFAGRSSFSVGMIMRDVQGVFVMHVPFVFLA